MKKTNFKTSALSRQPGRFALVDLEKPFVRRARHQKARGKLHELLARACEEHQEERVVGKFHLLLSKAKTQVPKGSLKKPSKKEAQAAVADLLAILQQSAPEALSARVVLKDGKLKAETPQEPKDERERLNPESLAVLYPSNAVLYPHSTVVRLYK
jgi:hypothetical protein